MSEPRIKSKGSYSVCNDVTPKPPEPSDWNTLEYGEQKVLLISNIKNFNYTVVLSFLDRFIGFVNDFFEINGTHYFTKALNDFIYK